MRNRWYLLFILFIISCTAPNALVKNQSTGNAFGTTYSIIYIADRELDFEKEIDSVIEAVNKSMSTYMPSSDISKINDGDSTIVVDAMFKDVFELSTEVYKASDGYFDPSIGVLANAWGFGPGEQIKLDSVHVDSLLKFVGWEKVRLNADNTISKKHPEIRFDFNAIAKGYAIDRLGLMLDKNGIKNFLVEVGGEVLAKGTNAISKKQWKVGIDNPNNILQRGTAAVVRLKDKALASSGNYRKFRIDPETGEKYVHTIDPITGFTKNSKVLAASVIAHDCATADAYATTFMALDVKKSIKLLKEHSELDAFIIYLSEKDSIQTYLTPGFEELLID